MTGMRGAIGIDLPWTIKTNFSYLGNLEQLVLLNGETKVSNTEIEDTYSLYARAIDEKRYELLERVFHPEAQLQYNSHALDLSRQNISEIS
jgi:hypothetical protein